MLLNNDYYLDTKQMIMSKEISSLINNTDALYGELMNHVKDDSLHGKDPIIIQNITQTVQGQGDDETVFLGSGYNSDALVNDAIYYLPITYNAGKINNIISSIPHNLNTHTIVFLFVIPDEYILDEDDKNEKHEYVLNLGNDNILFSNFYNGTIIVLGDFLQETKTKLFQKFKKKSKLQIEDPIKNDAINIKRYIANVFNEIDNNEQINEIIKYESNEVLEGGQTFNKIIIEGNALNDYYSLITFNDVDANVYVKNLTFRSSLKPRHENTNVIEDLNLNEDNLPSTEKLLLLYPLENNTEPIIGETFLNMLNDSINVPIFNQLGTYVSRINEKLDVYDRNISGLIDEIEKFKVYSFKEMNIKSPVILDELINLLDTITLRRENILKTQPSLELDDYKVGASQKFDVDKAKSLMSNYTYYVNEFLTDFKTFFADTNFRNFLMDRIDLVDTDLDTEDDKDIVEIYKKQYYNEIYDNVKKCYDFIKDEIIASLFGSYNFERRLSFTTRGNVTKDSCIEKNLNSNILTNYYDGSCKAIRLETGNKNIENGYLELGDSYLSGLFNVIFKRKYWSELKNRFDTTLAAAPTMNDSRYDTTICFWTKNDSFSFDNVSYLSFKFSNDEGIDDICSFIFKGHSIEAIDESIEYNINSLNLNNKNNWMFWTIKIDNENVESIGSLNGKMCITCNVYANEFENNSYIMRKYTLVGISRNSYITSPILNKTNPFKDVKLYLGYSNFKSSNNVNKDYFTGYFRNFMIYAGHLTDSECIALFKNGIQPDYNFISEYNDSNAINLFNTGDFFVGLIGSYNVSNINILNCVMKYNGKYLNLATN
jgi:hypothetical protein